MASDNEIMRLKATVEDDATATIAKIQKAMHAAHLSSVKDQREHAKNVREHQKAYKELGEATKALMGGGGIGGAFSGVAGRLGAVGIAIGVAVEAINKASEAVKQLGQRSANLMDLSRQANMTTDAFQRLESQMIYLNIAQEKADKSLTTFGNRWRDLSSGHPSMKAIGEVEDGDLSGVYERYVKPNLSIKDSTTAMRKIIDDVKNSGQPVQMQARIYSQLGLPDDYAYKSKAEIAEARQHERVALDKAQVEQLEESRKRGLLQDQSSDRAKSWVTSKMAKPVDAIHDFMSKVDESVFGTGVPDETKKTIKESTTEGTKEGFLQAWREITGSSATFNDRFQFGGKPGDGTLVPQAYHPDGGVAQTVKALHSGGGYTVLPNDGGDDGGGNSRGNRNNNRGNLKFGPLAKSFGATYADDKGFAVFPDQASGDAAHEALLKSKAYSGLTLDQFGNKYAEGNSSWKDTVGKALGIGRSDIVNNNDPRLPGAIRTAEGTNGGGGAAANGNITSGVPSAILAQARKAALQGGPGAVSRFMAANGYPRAGNWCGEFAAAVVTSAGGTPPKNPQVASNWRNWGSPTDSPVAGDIAVRRGTRTGNTGSHVTIVEDYDAKTGGFTGLGGNQGAFERRFRGGQYDFRHGNNPPAFTDAHGLGGAHLSDRAKHGTHHKLSVDFNNMPKGVRTGYSGDKGLFKEVKLNRGRAMGFASQDA
jgi:hypothetical protein